MDSKLTEMLRAGSTENGNIMIAPLDLCRNVASAFGSKLIDVEIEALRNGICPSRYRRNIGTIGIEGQAKLLSSKAAVIGCGGLGGWIIEMLARAGVGEIVMVDADVFDDSNLNRQLFSTEANIGEPKAIAAAKRVRDVNSAVRAAPIIDSLNEKNAAEILYGSDVVLDALDNNISRRKVFEACSDMRIPFVHGAIGGMFGQLGVFYQGDRPLWEKDDVQNTGLETETGNPPFTPAFVAALEVSEALKILTGTGDGIKGELLWFDLKTMELHKIKINSGS